LHLSRPVRVHRPNLPDRVEAADRTFEMFVTSVPIEVMVKICAWPVRVLLKAIFVEKILRINGLISMILSRMHLRI